jgi:hypothetical protein
LASRSFFAARQVARGDVAPGANGRQKKKTRPDSQDTLASILHKHQSAPLLPVVWPAADPAKSSLMTYSNLLALNENKVGEMQQIMRSISQDLQKGGKWETLFADHLKDGTVPFNGLVPVLMCKLVLFLIINQLLRLFAAIF